MQAFLAMSPEAMAQHPCAAANAEAIDAEYELYAALCLASPPHTFAFKHEPAHGAKGATHDHSPCSVVSLPRRVFDRLLASPDNES